MNSYKILGIDRNSSETEIKKAYRELVKQHHPDKGGSQEKFKEINTAYNDLMNPDQGTDAMDGMEEINRIFSMFKNIYKKGPVIRTTISLTLEQLEIGGVYKVSYTKNIPTGSFVEKIVSTPFGEISANIPEEKPMIFECKIEIPPCSDEKLPLVYPDFIKNGVDSDLEVRINLEKHPLFSKHGGLDLSTELEITLKESLVGFERELLLLGNDVPTKIVCNTVVNPYDSKIIQGYGMNNGFKTGDLYVKFKIRFPVLLTGDVTAALKEMDL